MSNQTHKDLKKLEEIKGRYFRKVNMSDNIELDIAWLISTLTHYLKKELGDIT